MSAPIGWFAIKGYYGWTEHYMGDLDTWASQMILVAPPAGRVFTYDSKPCRGLRVHPKIAEELKVCLNLVNAAGLWSHIQAVGGGYNFRTQKGSEKLSMHALGAAVDFAPHHNALGVPPEETDLGTEPGLGVVRLFEARGWTWGGRWSRPDGMHFQWGGGF